MAEWYVSELILEITVAGDPRNVVHRNLVLIRADSPDEAFEKSVLVGKTNEDVDENPAGMEVRVRFRGLGALDVVHDKLEHGAELLFQEIVDLSNEAIEKLVQPKERLGVFRPIEPTTGPDYSSKEVMREARKIMGER